MVYNDWWAYGLTIANLFTKTYPYDDPKEFLDKTKLYTKTTDFISALNDSTFKESIPNNIWNILHKTFREYLEKAGDTETNTMRICNNQDLFYE